MDSGKLLQRDNRLYHSVILPNSPTLLQLWDALGSKLIEATQGQLSYTQEFRGSSPLPPIIASILALARQIDPKKGNCFDGTWLTGFSFLATSLNETPEAYRRVNNPPFR